MSSHTSDSDGALNAQEENWEDWEDDESAVVKSLFSDDTFASVDEALAFDLKAHSFDLKALLIQVSWLCMTKRAKVHGILCIDGSIYLTGVAAASPSADARQPV